eukprot:g726.t1
MQAGPFHAVSSHLATNYPYSTRPQTDSLRGKVKTGAGATAVALVLAASNTGGAGNPSDESRASDEGVLRWAASTPPCLFLPGSRMTGVGGRRGPKVGGRRGPEAGLQVWVVPLDGEMVGLEAECGSVLVNESRDKCMYTRPVSGSNLPEGDKLGDLGKQCLRK